MIASFYSLCEELLTGLCLVIGTLAIFMVITFIVFLIESIISEVRDLLPNSEKTKKEDNKTDKNNYLKL